METKYEPRPEHKFTFGLWTVANTGSDPFGGAVRESKSPVDLVYLLADVGAYGVNFHDNDLIPIDASAAEADQIKASFKKALADTGLVVPMTTTNLFYDPVFRDGAFTSNSAKVRNYAIQKTMKSIDLGAEMGAKVIVFWGGREGIETDASKDPVTSIKKITRGHELLVRICPTSGLWIKICPGSKTQRTARRSCIMRQQAICWHLLRRWTIRKWLA